MPLLKGQIEQIQKDFGIHAKDSGSTTVQIAALSMRINELTGHLQTHKKDFSCKRSLLKMIGQRRAFLNYLRRVDENQYTDMIKRLGLRK